MSRRGALGLLLLLAGCGERAEVEQAPAAEAARVQAAAHEDEAPLDPLDPGPAVRVSGARALDVKTQLFFFADPEREHTLRTSYGFPERGRWELSIADPDVPPARRLEYRFGGRAWELGQGARHSRPLDGDERAALLRRMELRLALFLWPAGPAWRPDPEHADRRRAELARGAGTLEADLGPAGLPARMASFDAGGEPAETYLVGAWSSARPPRPAELALEVQGQPIWNEVVERLETRAYFKDVFFRPVDRQEDETGGEVSTGEVGGRR